MSYFDSVQNDAYNSLHNKMLDLASNYVKYAKRLLDVGCNDGEFTMKFARQLNAKEVYGLEVIPELVKQSKNKGIKVKNCDLNKGEIPFQTGFFDAVLCNQIFEHLYNPEHLLKEINRVLRENGLLFISTPNLASLHNRLFLLLGEQPPSLFTTAESLQYPINRPRQLDFGGAHVSVVAPDVFRNLLKKYFEILELCGSGFHPFKNPISNYLSKLFPRFSVYQIAICKKVIKK